MNKFISSLFKRINSVSNYYSTQNMGRWGLKDNNEIKMILANMDCCGDNLCSKPENYSKITTILDINKK